MKNLGKIITFFIILLILSFILILFRDQIFLIDESLFFIINGFSNPFLDGILIPITYFGSLIFWILVIIIAWIKKERKLSIYLLYAIIIDSLLSLSLKWVFRRARPEELLKKTILKERDLGPSFPSGHTERAFSGAVIVNSFYKILEFETAFYILAFLVGISRIYLAVHYPIDTLFGALIGIIIGNIILNLPTEKVQEKIEGFIFGIKMFFQKYL
ncbi:MAG: phosphatase PAP2 family protein [Candidatus Aenigmarchaeota archaeon]|nr:phosphatase PAP2 family protein [Candidatus Aenigmarchaeota archaeon]